MMKRRANETITEFSNRFRSYLLVRVQKASSNLSKRGEKVTYTTLRNQLKQDISIDSTIEDKKQMEQLFNKIDVLLKEKVGI